MTQARIPLIFALVALATLWPFAVYDALPITDLPNHMHRHRLLSERADPGAWAEFWSIDLRLIPNGAADYLLLLWPGRLDPLLAGRVTMALSGLGLMAAMMALYRALWGRWSAMPLLGAALTYNGALIWGFENYVLTMPLGIGALALWVAMENRPVWARLAAMLPLAFALYAGHLIIYGLTAIAIGGYALGRAQSTLPASTAKAAREIALPVIAFLPGALHFLSTLLSPAPGHGGGTYMGRLTDRLDALRWVAGDEISWTQPVSYAATALLALALFGALLVAWRGGARQRPEMRPALALLALTAALTPSLLMGVAFTAHRVPVFVMAVALGATNWDALRPALRRAATTLVACAFAVRLVTFALIASAHSTAVTDILTASADLPDGARLLAVNERPVVTPDMWHFGAYVAAAHDVFLPTAFNGATFLTVQPDWQDRAPSQSFAITGGLWLNGPGAMLSPAMIEREPELYYWRDWEEAFTHVIVLAPGKAAQSFVAEGRIAPLATSGEATVFAICAQTPCP